MGEIEPRKRAVKAAVPMHIPQEIVPIPIDNIREFVGDALKGTSIMDPVVGFIAGWSFFEPHVRFTQVDAAHTRVEFVVTSKIPGGDVLFYQERRAEIDRFFVALQDQLDRLARWHALPPAEVPSIQRADQKPLAIESPPD